MDRLKLKVKNGKRTLVNELGEELFVFTGYHLSDLKDFLGLVNGNRLEL